MLARPTLTQFDLHTFLSTGGTGRTVVRYKAKEVVFTQGDPAEFVFYVQTGRIKLGVGSTGGKEATLALLSDGAFFGEQSLVSNSERYSTGAVTLIECRLLKIEKDVMHRTMREEYAFSSAFLAFLLAQGQRNQENLVDHLFNSSEKRLARILLSIAESGSPDDRGLLVPPFTQEELADLVGTTRSRVSFFMNRFRKLGLIDYDGRIWVHTSLLSVVLSSEAISNSNKSATKR